MPYTGVNSVKKTTRTITGISGASINTIGVNDSRTRIVSFQGNMRPAYATGIDGSFGLFTSISTGDMVDNKADYGAMSNDGMRLIAGAYGIGNVYTSYWDVNTNSYNPWKYVWRIPSKNFNNVSISETGDYITLGDQAGGTANVFSSYLNGGNYSTPVISYTGATQYHTAQVSRSGQQVFIYSWQGAGDYTVQIGSWNSNLQKYGSYYNITTNKYGSNGAGFSPDDNIIFFYNHTNTSLRYSLRNTVTGLFDNVNTVSVYASNGTTLINPTNSQCLIITPYGQSAGKLYNCSRGSNNTIDEYDILFAGSNVIPITDISFDRINTKQVALGNVQVSINDANNSATNNLYYFYSVNTPIIPNANSFVLNTGSGRSPYKFFIPTTDISNTIYVQAKNASGGTSNIANLQVISYIQPQVPPFYNVTFVGSGNLQVTVGEGSPSYGYYYLNNVSYVAYLYAGGTNQSGNLRYYTSNVGVLAPTNTTYGNVVSYISNISANAYTVYVIARNDFGNSNPVSTNIQVYTTPQVPSIDTGNTKSLTSGNLTVAITDTVNSSANGIYYLYSTDNIAYGNSGVSTTAGNTKYTFTIQDTGNAFIPLVANTYTLYIKASNSIGNSVTTSAPVQVYTTPLASIEIDATNTQSLTSGNLTVYVNDTVNSSTNGIYYLYSTDGITYGNSGAFKIGNTTVFTISNTGNAQVPLTAQTYTLYIAAANPIGNSISNPAIAVESVYTIPSPPTIDQTNTKSVTSGNLNVVFTDTTNGGNNQVEYIYYLYDPTTENKIIYL